MNKHHYHFQDRHAYHLINETKEKQRGNEAYQASSVGRKVDKEWVNTTLIIKHNSQTLIGTE
jgi:hypothetical protein